MKQNNLPTFNIPKDLLKEINMFCELNKIEDIDDDTVYFIINTLNQLNTDSIRNKLLLKVLPLKV